MCLSPREAVAPARPPGDTFIPSKGLRSCRPQWVPSKRVLCLVVLLTNEGLLQMMKGVSTEDNLDCKCLLKIDFSASVAEKVGCVLPLPRSRRAADEEPSLLLPLDPVSVPSRPLPPGVGLYHPTHSRSHRRKRTGLESAMMRSHFPGGTAARLFITETHVPVFRVPAL